MIIMSITLPVDAGAPDEPTPIDVEEHRYGWIIRIPRDRPHILLAEQTALCERARDAGLKLMSPALAHVLRCNDALLGHEGPRVFDVFAWGDEAHRAWMREALEAQPKLSSPVERWLAGPEWGMASARLAYALTGHKAPGAPPPRAATPVDADSFRRCVEVLDLAPELRERLGELADGAWAPYVANWTRLETLLRAGHLDALDRSLAALRVAHARPEPEIVLQLEEAEVMIPQSFLARLTGAQDVPALVAQLQMERPDPNLKVR